MKKYLGHIIVFILGVIGTFSLMFRCEDIDNHVSQENRGQIIEAII